MNKSVKVKVKELEIAYQIGRVEEARNHQSAMAKAYGGKRGARYTDATRLVKKEESALVDLVMGIFGGSAS